ncbi:MAG: phosphatidate cytidylyltransferase [Nitrospirales bacterium]|nr:phosphatidate cytidylyltransferase [Nitrospira sp.]MDR4501955.1 phosphatidate cytidylyltransferase [Nitrospirales bacterium]
MSNDPTAPKPSFSPESAGQQGRSHRFTLERVYPALLFAPLFYLVVRYAPPIAFFALIVVVAGLALWEFTKMTEHSSPSLSSLLISFTSLVLILTLLQWTTHDGLTGFFTLLLIGLLIFLMFAPGRLRQMISHPLGMLFGVFYIGLCLGHLLLIRKLESGDLLIFFVILVTWAADTAGYYVGASIGTRAIAPRLSPKKTIEGFMAGMIFSMLMAVLCHFWFLPSLSIVHCLVLGILLSCVGLLGDLAESAFKRSAGIKDSGSLIPGHGGFLDRIDSLLLTAPTFYYYMLTFGPLA